MVSAPSVADIGLSGTRETNSTSDDQPLASAIGISGTAAYDARRRTASRTTKTAASPATSISSRRHSEASLALASAASTGTPTTAALTPGGGFRRERMSSITL